MKGAFVFSVLLLCFVRGLAIAPPLEREINLVLNNEPVKSALVKIQEQTGLVFSYRSSIISNLSPVSLQLKQKTVREALALILPHNILVKSKNNYIILKERPLESNSKKTELSGYVVDKVTDKKIPNVTIYDKTTLKSVTTDEYGYYSISLPKEQQCLKVNKENYRDTCVPVTGPFNFATISIDRVSDSVRTRDSVNWRSKLKDFSNYTNGLFKSFKGYVNTLNVHDTFTRKFQLSFIPFLGTNGLMSGNVYNKYSVNVFGGYSRGTRALELGGFFNVNKEKMQGAQMAGFFNVVGDTAEGVQLAGFFNVTGRNMTGVQGAGFMNFNLGNVSGLQAAGLINFNLHGIKGVCAAGLLNVNRFSVEGVQLAGLLNVTADTLSGISAAGLMNLNWYSKESMELAGLMNHAFYGKGNVQVSGLMNSTARGNSNLQISALFNRTQRLTGFQLGLLNYADTASGIPFGFLSFVKKGVHQLEVSSNELFYANLGFRTGVPAFYNILSLGIKPGGSSTLWEFGYGLGTSFKLSPKLRGDFSATSHHVSSGSFYFATSELYRFYLGFEYKFHNKFALAAGPTFNMYWSDALLPDYAPTYSKVAPYYMFNKNLPNDFNLKGWFGARVAVRFL